MEYTVDENSLNVLPLDCLVLEMLPVHDEDENIINSTSSTLSSQERRTDQKI